MYKYFPEFSVVIPVHNKKPHLDRSISSVLKQNFNNFELIIIDDASTDGSYQEIKKFKDERIKIFQRETPGPGGYAARNLGIKKAKGEWVAFLDADDEWEKTHLENLKILSKEFSSAQILSSAYRIINKKNKPSYDDYFEKSKDRGAHYFELIDFIKGPRPIWTCTVAIKRDMLLDTGGFDENWKHGADTEYWLRILLTGTKGAWTPKIGATYFKNSVNMVTDNLSQIESPSAEAVMKYLKLNPDSNLSQDLKRFANNQYYKPFIRRSLGNGFNFKDLYQKFYFSQFNRFLLVLAFLSLFPKVVQNKLAEKVWLRNKAL